MAEKFRTAIKLQKETSKGKKALIVTEKIETGQRIISIARELREIGITYDIAAVRIHMDDEFYREAGVLSKESSLYGQRGTGMPAIARSRLSGIQRRNSTAIRSEGISELVATARQDIKHAVNFLLENA